jgi:hypothetical protein
MGRAANFCGADGLEICEPLTFKGREGSGHPGGRNAYLGTDSAKDWRKFAESYRLWGRLLYNPDATPDSWRRSLKRKFGSHADSAERALSAASRVLPLLTSAHLPSASNHSLWYEMYTNQPIVSDSGYRALHRHAVTARFRQCQSAGPAAFLHHHRACGRPPGGPRQRQIFARRSRRMAGRVAGRSNHALTNIDPPCDTATRRLVEDAAIQSGLAHFFAAKLRAGMFFVLWQKAQSREAGAGAVEAYSQARDAWAKLAERAKGVYAADVSYGEIPQRRGHWSDRLAAIDADLAAMKSVIAAQPGGDDGAALLPVIAQPMQRLMTETRHVPIERFASGADLPVVLSGAGSTSAQLFYRHVNHGERWRSLAMSQEGDSFRAAIPGAYTSSPYPLQYYFVLQKGSQAALYPGFNATFSNQPYFAVWKRG